MNQWWQRGIVYQIYPRSFQDSNRDGIGDLPGIIQRLSYLTWLGIDAIWISPIYPSPMADFGYDVSNYTDIHPMFGTLDDMNALIDAAHRQGLKVILDFVPNHTSDQHPWFLESRQSVQSAKRDWYIWRDPAPDGGPPTNWLSRFDGESAWEWDEKTGQYYLHSFLKEQPDVNWRNPELREAMLDVLRFWYERGIDGFRVDVSYRVMKDAQFRDNPPNPAWQPGMDPSKQVIETYTKNTPDIHIFNRWLREVNDEFAGRVLIGEINLPIPQLVKHYGDEENGRLEFHLPFNFRLIYTDWQPELIQALAEQYEANLPAGAWPNWVLGNHDQHRVASRVGKGQARVAMTLLLTLRGTPTLYYGDEIGMVDGEISPDRVQDPWEKFVPGIGLGRDPERTPMQWDSSLQAGFCAPDVEPWLPVNENKTAVNVQTQQADPRSMLNMSRTLIQLRRQYPALHAGTFDSVAATDTLLAYRRTHGQQHLLILLNFSDEPQTWNAPYQIKTVLFSTVGDQPTFENSEQVDIRPNEGLIFTIEPA